MEYVCTAFSTVLINTYRSNSRLIIRGNDEIPSCEGTTQGDNLAMSFYALGISPLISQLKATIPDVKQIWLADDATGAGKLEALRICWDTVIKEGEKVGYFVNESKSWIIIKDPNRLDEAKEIFRDSKIKFTLEGKRHLGAALGNEEFKVSYMKEKIEKWCSEVNKLSGFAETQPQAAFFSVHTW